MDADRFDAITKFLTSAANRRRTLGGLLGVALGALTLAGPDAEARSRKCKRDCGECATCKKGKCKRKHGKKRCKKGKCKPKADGIACSSERVCRAGSCTCPIGEAFCGSECGCCVPNTPISGGPIGRQCVSSEECCDGGTCCNFSPREGPRCFDLLSHDSACGTTCENIVNCFNFNPARRCVNGQCIQV